MIAEFRDMNEKLALYTNVGEIERRLKRMKSCIYWLTYYDDKSGKAIGTDLYFEKSARKTLSKVANNFQLPLL